MIVLEIHVLPQLSNSNSFIVSSISLWCCRETRCISCHWKMSTTSPKKQKFFSLCASRESLKFQTSVPSLVICLGAPSARLSEIPHLDVSSIWKCVALGSVCYHITLESQVSCTINNWMVDSRKYTLNTAYWSGYSSGYSRWKKRHLNNFNWRNLIYILGVFYPLGTHMN